MSKGTSSSTLAGRHSRWQYSRKLPRYDVYSMYYSSTIHYGDYIIILLQEVEVVPRLIWRTARRLHKGLWEQEKDCMKKRLESYANKILYAE